MDCEPGTPSDSSTPVSEQPTLSSLPPELLVPIFTYAASKRAPDPPNRVWNPAALFTPLLTLNSYLSSVVLPILYGGTVTFGICEPGVRANDALLLHADEERKGSRFAGSYTAWIRHLRVRIHVVPYEEPPNSEILRLLKRCVNLNTLILGRMTQDFMGMLGGPRTTVRPVLEVLDACSPELKVLNIDCFGTVDLRDGFPGRLTNSLESLEVQGSQLLLPGSDAGTFSPCFSLRTLILGEYALHSESGELASANLTASALPSMFPNLVAFEIAMPSSQFPPPLEDILPRFEGLERLTVKDGWNLHPRFLACLPGTLSELKLHSTPLSQPWLSYLRGIKSVELDNCLFDARELGGLSKVYKTDSEHRLETLKVILHDAPLRTRTRKLFEELVKGGGLGFELNIVYS